jgi:hypothetical protein
VHRPTGGASPLPHPAPRRTDLVITAAAFDSGGTVAKVEFFRADEGAKFGEYIPAHTWRKPSYGDHLLRVRGTDTAGTLSPLRPSVPVTLPR